MNYYTAYNEGVVAVEFGLYLGDTPYTNDRQSRWRLFLERIFPDLLEERLQNYQWWRDGWLESAIR